MDNNPTPAPAPAEAPATGTEQNTTNQASTPAPSGTENTPTQTTPVQPADPNAWLNNAPEDVRRFFENNGGFEGIKKTVSGRTVQQFQPQQVQSAPTPADLAPAQAPAQQPQNPVQPTQKGMLTVQDMVIQQYFNNLASQEQYAPIAEEIRSGEIFKQMAALGTNPFDANGSVNEPRLKNFLDMYAKTKPATPPSNPEVAGQTVDYVQVPEGQPLTQELVTKILSQPNHPSRQQALDFLYNRVAGKKS